MSNAATKQLWLDYRQELRDGLTTFGLGTANEISAYMVNSSVEPGRILQQ